MMLMSVLSITGYATPTSDETALTTETNQTIENNDDCDDYNYEREEDFSLRVSTRVNLVSYVHHTAPDVTLVFTNSETGEVTEVKLNKDNFDEYTESFKLPIDFADKSEDTKFTVAMKTSDPFLTSLCDDTMYDETVGRAYTVCEANSEGMEVTVTKYGLDLAICCTRTSDFIVNTVDKEGNKIPNIKLRVANGYTGACKEYTTDENGSLVLSADEVEGSLYFVCLSEGYKNAGDESYFYALSASTIKSTIPVLDIELEKAEVGAKANSFNINVVSDSTVLFRPTSMVVSLNSDKNEYTFSELEMGTNTVKIADGTYNVEVDNTIADVDFPATVDTGSDLTLKVVPKNTLKVYNSKDDCKFSIINIDEYADTVFDSAKEFGVILNQSIMIKNLNTDNTYTVVIASEGVTELDLADGTKYATEVNSSNGYAPPTGDWIDWVILVFIIAFIALIIVLFLLYKNNKNSKPPRGNSTSAKTTKTSASTVTKLMSLLLVGVMAMSLVSEPINVFAWSTNDDTVSSSLPSGQTKPGSQQAYNGIDIGYATLIKLSLVPNLTASATIDELAQRNKFDYRDSILYLAQDKNVGISRISLYDSWISGGDMVSWLDSYNAVAGSGTSMGKIWWKDASESDAYVNTEERDNRILPIAREADTMEGWKNDDSYGFYKVILPFFTVNNINVDDSFGSKLNDYLKANLNIDGTNPDKQKATEEFVAGYLNILKGKIGVSEEKLNKYKEAFANSTLSLMVETTIGTYKKGNEHSGGNPGPVNYVSTHDAMELLQYAGTATGNDFTKYEIGFEGKARDAYNAKDDKSLAGGGNAYETGQIGNLPYSIGGVLVTHYLRTLKPSAQSITDAGYNPFGGWAFFNLGKGEPSRVEDPGVYGEIHYTLYDKSGNPIGGKEVEVDGYSFAERTDNMLKRITRNTPVMLIPNSITIDGVNYDAPEQEVPVKACITDNDGNYLSDLDSAMIVSTEVGDNGWYYEVSSLVPYVNTLNEALTHEDADADHIKYVFEVAVYPSETQAIGAGEIPEWRVNKYWEKAYSLTDTESKLNSTATLSYSTDSGCYKRESKIESQSVRPLIEDLGSMPFISIPNMGLYPKTGTFYKPSGNHKTVSKQVWGDLMAFKDYNVDDLTVADWVDKSSIVYEASVPYIGYKDIRRFEIGSSSGDTKKKGNNLIFYSETNGKRLWLNYYFEPAGVNGSTGYFKGLKINHIHSYHAGHTIDEGCACGTCDENVTFTTSTKAQYGLDITFNCHNKKPLEAYKSFTNTAIKDLDTGFADFTEQSSKSIRLFAEYPMLFTDVTHQDSIRFMTADDATEFAPISYHTLKYDAKVVPNISGVAATDSRATDTLVDMGMGDAQMLPRGSMTTSSYEVEGTLTAKTYALDFKSDKTSYKNLWNSEYSATKVNDEFLDKFSSWDAETNTYKATLNAFENLKIDSQLYGNIENDISISAGMSDVEEYELTIRAGEITAINGYKDWKTRYPEVADILIDKLKANHDGVFSVFNVGDGDELTEDKFAELAGAAREYSPSIAVGTGWYSEDTTVLSLYVYTTTFSLKGTTFANKIPTSISGLEAPQDKSLFYSKAFEGNLQLDLTLEITPTSDGVYDERCAVALQYSTDSDRWADSEYKLYAVPNVSVLDNTF